MSPQFKYEDVQFERFNESLDEGGEIAIANFSALPSRILFDMDPVAYETAFNEFREQEFEDLKEIIYRDYPSCIAYNFRQSEKGEGASDPIRKLLHLKDTWESIVFVLYAIVWGEVRYKNIDLKNAQVFVSNGTSGAPIFESFNSKKLLSDALKQKIQNIKAVIQYSKDSGLGFKCECIEIELLEKLLQLQDIRNDISHHNTPTKEQAEQELQIVSPVFKEMLSCTAFLEHCKILRFDSLRISCKCEVFNGHALNKEFEEFNFTPGQKTYVISLGQDALFLKWDSEIYGLSPFLHFDKDISGHESFLCHYKRKKEGKYWFEPIKIRKPEKSFDYLTPRFDSEKDVLLQLIVP